MDPLDTASFNPQPATGADLLNMLADPNLGRQAQAPLSAASEIVGQDIINNLTPPATTQPQPIGGQQSPLPMTAEQQTHMAGLLLKRTEAEATQALGMTHQTQPAPATFSGNPPGLNVPQDPNLQIPIQTGVPAPTTPDAGAFSTPSVPRLTAPVIDETRHAELAKSPEAMQKYFTEMMQSTAAAVTQSNMQQMVPLMHQMSAEATQRTSLLNNFFSQNEIFMNGEHKMENVVMKALQDARTALPGATDQDVILLAGNSLSDVRQLLETINHNVATSRTHDLRNRATFTPQNPGTRNINMGQGNQAMSKEGQLFNNMVAVQNGTAGDRAASATKFLSELNVE